MLIIDLSNRKTFLLPAPNLIISSAMAQLVNVSASKTLIKFGVQIPLEEKKGFRLDNMYLYYFVKFNLCVYP